MFEQRFAGDRPPKRACHAVGRGAGQDNVRSFREEAANGAVLRLTHRLLDKGANLTLRGDAAAEQFAGPAKTGAEPELELLYRSRRYVLVPVQYRSHMIILVSSKISHKNIHASLGKPEYSYFFLMKDFLPALERIGTVIQVQSLEEVDALHASYSAQGEKVVFLSVSPPQQTPVGLDCPTVILFAWEFDSIPELSWDDDPHNNWRYVFSGLQGAICTSRETAQLVREASRPEFPVIALPAPIWDRYAGLGSEEGWPARLEERTFEFSGLVIDSPLLGLSADGLVRKPEPDIPAAAPVVPVAPPRMGLGAAWQLSVALLRGWWGEMRRWGKSEVSADGTRHVGVSGVVYSTVLNPADGRKNWVDIVTAFCWAFKNTEDATLVVKMTHHDLEYYRIVLLTLLSRLAPFKCRVLVLHGFLEDSQYQTLIGATSYYVNASTGEGLCLPLMEFLASGKPAIAPAHTAMADYLNPQMAFVLRTSLEPTCWPHDPTGMLFTRRHRLNWQSLMESFRASYEVAKEQPEQYQCMSREAYRHMREFASVAQVAGPLETFLNQVVATPARKEMTQ